LFGCTVRIYLFSLGWPEIPSRPPGPTAQGVGRAFPSRRGFVAFSALLSSQLRDHLPASIWHPETRNIYPAALHQLSNQLEMLSIDTFVRIRIDPPFYPLIFIALPSYLSLGSEIPLARLLINLTMLSAKTGSGSAIFAGAMLDYLPFHTVRLNCHQGRGSRTCDNEPYFQADELAMRYMGRKDGASVVSDDPKR
jgi:hypothetical protein